MTQSKAGVLWIDDDPARERDAKNLCDSQLDVEFQCKGLDVLKPGALAKYDLLLIDYRLDRLPGQTRPFRGPAVVGLLRSVDDDTPAYLVSVETAAGRAKFSGLTWFEESLSLDEIQDVRRMRVRLKNDIDGYRAIGAVTRRSSVVRAIAELLRVPAESQQSLLEAIPASIKAALVRSSDAPAASGAPEAPGRLGFARWVRRVLLVKRGPLLPTLDAATRVGMKPLRFHKSRAFAVARYDGIFSKSYESLWWAALLDSIVVDHQRRAGLASGPPWELGPKLFRVPNRDIPKCAVCGKLYPEIVAREVDANREAAVHQRHCSPDPDRDFTPFFAEERVFKGAN